MESITGRGSSFNASGFTHPTLPMPFPQFSTYRQVVCRISTAPVAHDGCGVWCVCGVCELRVSRNVISFPSFGMTLQDPQDARTTLGRQAQGTGTSSKVCLTAWGEKRGA